MLYKIVSVDNSPRSEKHCQDLLDEYPCLANFGWKIVEYIENCYEEFLDEYGRAIYRRGPKTCYRPYIEINTLEELQKLQAAVQNPLIFTEDEIEIYDNYRE